MRVARFRSWSPTLAALGSGVASSSISTADYRQEGATAILQLDFSVVLASAGTPSAITATLPAGLTPSQPRICYGFVTEDSGGSLTYSPGILAPYTDGMLYARKADNSPFAAGTTVNFRGVAIYER